MYWWMLIKALLEVLRNKLTSQNLQKQHIINDGLDDREWALIENFLSRKLMLNMNDNKSR